MIRSVCNVRNNVPLVYAMKTPLNETTKPIDHFKKVEELSKTKVNFQRKLDKTLNNAMTYCSEDKTSLICKIFWEDVHNCLVDIDNINHEIKYHKWYMFIEDE